MTKQMALCVAAGLVGSVAFAQETTATHVTAANTTAAISQATTASAQISQDTARTSMSALMAKNFSEEKSQARWQTEKKLYQEAGLPEEKIQKLHDLNLATWKAMGAGEMTDYQAYLRERDAILSPEEKQKIRATQRAAIAERVQQRDEATSASQM